MKPTHFSVPLMHPSSYQTNNQLNKRDSPLINVESSTSSPTHLPSSPHFTATSCVPSSLNSHPTRGTPSNDSTSPPTSISHPPLKQRTHPMVTRSQNNIFKPKQVFATTKHPYLDRLNPLVSHKPFKIQNGELLW